MQMRATIKKVNSIVRHTIPSPDENISEILDIDEILIIGIKQIIIWPRGKEECPFGRGNWLIDIHFNNEEIYCIKLPLEMDEDKVLDFAKPLIEKLTLSPQDGIH